jgi:TonB family protein
MEAVVSDILESRKREPGGLRQTAMVSLGVHGAALALIAILPAILPATKQQPRVVMNISLGGAPGPRTGGTQMIGGRRIDAALPSAAPEMAKTALPSPPARPEMSLPDPKQKPQAARKPAASSKDPKGTAAGRGAEAQLGTARVETGAKGQGFGLSSGGGGGDGMTLDVGNFCCPDYLLDMRNRILNNWNQKQGATGIVAMKYTVLRSGQITGIEVEKSSGNPTLDLASHRALLNTRAFSPLPAAFPDAQLTVHLEFEYERK